MEEGNENKGFFTSRIDSVLKTDTQTFFHHSSQPTPLPLNPIQNLNILFGYGEEALDNNKQVKTQFESQCDSKCDSKFKKRLIQREIMPLFFSNFRS